MTYPFVFGGSLFWTDPETGKKYYQAERRRLHLRVELRHGDARYPGRELGRERGAGVSDFYRQDSAVVDAGAVDSEAEVEEGGSWQARGRERGARSKSRILHSNRIGKQKSELRSMKVLSVLMARRIRLPRCGLSAGCLSPERDELVLIYADARGIVSSPTSSSMNRCWRGPEQR